MGLDWRDVATGFGVGTALSSLYLGAASYFRDEYKTYSGLSYIPAVRSPFSDYTIFRKNSYIASNFDAEIIGTQLLRYKKDYKSSKLPTPTENLSVLSSSTDELRQSIYDLNSGFSYPNNYFGFVNTYKAYRPDLVPVPNNGGPAVVASDDLFLDPHLPLLTRYVLSKVAINVKGVTPAYADYQLIASDGREYVRYSIGGTSYRILPSLIGSTTVDSPIINTFHYEIQQEVLVTPTEEILQVLEPSTLAPALDVRAYVYSTIDLNTSGGVVSKYCDIKFYDFTIYGDYKPLSVSDVAFAPSFSPSGMFDIEVKSLAKKFGIDYDSLVDITSSPNATSVDVGFHTSPDIIMLNKYGCRYMFNFFEQFMPNGGFDTFIQFDKQINSFSTQLKATITVSTRNDSIVINLFNSKAHGIREWEVICEELLTGQARYYADLKTLYDTHVGGGSTDATVMYNSLRAWTYSSPVTDLKKNTRVQIPPNTVKNNTRKTRIKFYVFCTLADIPNVLHYKMFEDNGDQRYAIVSQKEKKIANTLGTYEDYWYSKTVNGNGNVSFTIYKRLTATTFTELKFEDVSITHSLGGTQVVTNYTNTSDETFRIPTMWSAVNGSDMSFNEFACLHDHSLVTTIYSIQTTKITWWQTERFATVVRIASIVAAVVISYFTAGTGTSVSATILNLAVNMAVAYVIAVGVNYAGDKIGGDLGLVFKAVAAVIVGYYTQDITSLTGLFLKSSDEFLKYKIYKIQEDTEELAKQNTIFVNEMENLIRDFDILDDRFSSDIFPESIIDLMKSQADSDVMSMDTDTLKQLFDSIQEDDWKLAEVKPPDFLNDYSTYFDPTLDIPEGVTEFEGQITSFPLFGDDTVIDIDT